MKKRSISDVIGQIDERFVEEAAEYRVSRPVVTWQRWAVAVAACLVVCLSVSLGMGLLGSKTPSPTISPDTTATETDEPWATETATATEVESTTAKTEKPTESKQDPTGAPNDTGAPSNTDEPIIDGDADGVGAPDGGGATDSTSPTNATEENDPGIDPGDYILTDGPGCGDGYFYNYTEYDVPENLYITENTPLADKYAVYIDKYPVWHTGPLYENSEENRALAENNLKDFLKILCGEDKVDLFELVPDGYYGTPTAFPERYETELGGINISATAASIRAKVSNILDTSLRDDFPGDIEVFIDNNKTIQAMMKYAGITDYEILTHSDRDIVYYTLIPPTKPLTEMDTFEGTFIIHFTVYEGKVSAYHLNYRTTDGVLGEYETLPYTEALEAVKVAYPDAEHERIRAYVYYNSGFYKNEDAPNEVKLSGCLFPCYRFIIPGTKKVGDHMIAVADIPMTVYDAIMP